MSELKNMISWYSFSDFQDIKNQSFKQRSTQGSVLQWQLGFRFQYSCGNRRRQNWSVRAMWKSGHGNVRSIYVELQCLLAEDSEQPISRCIITRWHLNTPHHKIMTSLRIHIWYCWWVHSSLPVFWGCFPIRNQLKSCTIHCKCGASFLNQLCFGSK